MEIHVQLTSHQSTVAKGNSQNRKMVQGYDEVRVLGLQVTRLGNGEAASQEGVYLSARGGEETVVGQVRRLC